MGTSGVGVHEAFNKAIKLALDNGFFINDATFATWQALRDILEDKQHTIERIIIVRN